MIQNYDLGGFLKENRGRILEQWGKQLVASGEIGPQSLTALLADIPLEQDLLQLLATSFFTGETDREILTAIVNRIRLPDISITSFLAERSTLFSTIAQLDNTGWEAALNKEQVVILSQQLQALVDSVLKKTATIYEHVVENGGRSFCLANTEGIITYTNTALEQLSGKNKLAGQPLCSIFEKEHHTFIEKALLPTANASPAMRQLTMRTADNTQLTVGTEIAPIIIEGKHVGGYANMVNITASIQGTNRLMEQSPLGIIKINTRRKIVYSNPKMRELVGAEEDIWGEPIEKLFAPGENLETLNREIKKRFENGLASEYPAQILHQKENRAIPVMIAATPERDSEGNIIGSMAIIRSMLMENTINNIDNAIVTNQTVDKLLEQVALEVHNICPFNLLVISEYSKNLGHLRSVFVSPPPEQNKASIRWWIMPKGVHDWLISRKDDIIDDMEEFLGRPEWEKLRGVPALEDFLKKGLHSCIRIPVWDLEDQNKARLIASVTIFRLGKGMFSQKDQDQLNMLPLDKAVLAALHLEEKNRMTFRFSLFREILNACDNMRNAADLITSKIANFYQWNNVSIFRVDEKAKVFRLLSQKAINENPTFLLPDNFEQPLEQGIMGHVWRTGTSIFSGDVKNDPQIKEHYIDIYNHETNSELCMPLKAGEKIFWVMNIEDPQVNAFSSDEIEELKELHNEMIAVLDRAFEYHLLNETLSHASDGILVADCMWRIRRYNPAVKDLLGYGDRELRELHLETLFTDRETPILLQSGEQFPGKEVTMRKKSGATREVLLSTTKLPPEIGGTILILKDLSILKKMEELDYLGKLYYEIAVQTKTPISLLFSWLKRLQGDIPEERKSSILSKALQQLRKLTLTYDRLALYDKERGLIPYNPVLLDIREILKIVQQELPAIEWDRIILEQQSNIPPVRGDMFQIIFCLESILSYLLRSAGEEEKVQVNVGYTGESVFLKLSGAFPEMPDNVSGDNAGAAARLSETLADMALGEKVIESFITTHGGRYNSFRNGTEIEFSIELDPATERSML